MKTPERLTYALDSYSPFKKAVIKFIENSSGKHKLIEIYESIPEEHAGKPSFFDLVLEKLSIHVPIVEEQLAKIPKEGPLVFVANHPFGLLDGIVLGRLAASTRNSWAILINAAMDKFDDFADNMLPISFEETREASRTNITTKKKALKMLSDGGAILIFPAGGVMTSEGLFGPITGLEWKLFTAKMIQQSQATVVPVYFHGKNSRLFQVVSQVNYTLRSALFLRELTNKSHTTRPITIGNPIGPADYGHCQKKQELTDLLRAAVYDLGPADAVKVRQRKDGLDASIGQSPKDIRLERKQDRKAKRREKLKSILSS